MEKYVRKFNEEDKIFIRKSSNIEGKSKSAMKKAMNSFPEKEGYEIVYMPYGEEGRGFYYSKIEK